MDSMLIPLWDKAIKKLGAVGTFIPTIAKSIKKAIKDEDVEKIKGHTAELRDACASGVLFANYVDEVIADGTIDLEEGARIAVNFERFLDEAEDVVKGKDEDKATA